MNVLPIIVRELRAEARHPVNYVLRTLGAAILTGFLGFFLWDADNTQSGGNAFRALSIIAFCVIWIAAPLMTADCLSREKREGTLGLLFLTPLKPIEIVLGKGAIHAIRSLTLLLAGIPILTIPFVLGGITSANVCWSLFLNLNALILSLVAGLLASSLCRQWTRAVILAEIFSALFLLLFFKIAAAFLTPQGFQGNALAVSQAAYEILLAPKFRSYPPASGILKIQISTVFFIIFAAEIFLVGFIVFFAARRLRKSWQENPASLRQLWIQKTFCTPRFWVGFLRRQNQSRLSVNPIGWLQQYSWSARLSKWGWCAVVITIASWLLTADLQLLGVGFSWLKTAMLVSVAFSAVGSFQREKQNGALELLLVTPLREGQIIFGRLRGIWGQFLPAFAILILAAVSVRSFQGNYFYRRQVLELNVFGSICDFVVVPIVGLYFAMRLKNFMTAWLLTCGLTLFLPSFLGGLCIAAIYRLGIYNFSDEFWKTMSSAQILLMIFFGIGAASGLRSRLKHRSFALGRI
jgi:ABC-type transport system involved in multi-copper enzyme maturation permease subunit